MSGSGDSRRGLVLLAMTVANAMVLVDQTAVPLILPDIIKSFGVGSQQVQWVLNGSLLPLAGLLVFGGRLGDLVGRRTVFLVGSVAFAAASVCAGLAPNFAVLLAFRVLQGAGGALMLPTTIAIVSATFPPADRGRALGTMGGAAAVAGACGPVVGGGLTSWLGWRAVLLINAPLAVMTVLATLRSVPRDPKRTERKSIDLTGTALLCVALIAFVFGLTQSQPWGWGSPGVWGSLVLSLVAGVAFVVVERRSGNPLLEFGLLRRYPNYLGAVVSQAVGGMMEMGLALLFSLLLILNLGMSPGLAGVALIPTTLPMVAVAPLAGRWYDKVGGRIPLAAGFATLLVAMLVLAVAVHGNSYWGLLPGLVLFGVGLALVLTVNDPVSLDTVPDESQGEASGVSDTAEQFGGALGISVLYLVFHFTYVTQLHAGIAASPKGTLTPDQLVQLKDDIIASEQTGLHPASFDPSLAGYLDITRNASNWGFSVAFLASAALAAVGLVFAWRLVRRPAADEVKSPAA